MSSINKFDASGFRRFWEVRVPTGGKRADGSRPYVEAFYDIKSGQVHTPEGGWNGEPPRPDDFTPALTQNMGGSDEFWANMAKQAIAEAEKAGVPPPKWTGAYAGEVGNACQE